MSKEMFFQYIHFLKKHQLFDEATYQYIREHSVVINAKKKDDNFLMGCTTVLDEDKKLIDLIPCFPFMRNQKMVAVNVFVYVQTLMLLPRIGQDYEESSMDTLLPLLFFKLYILENSSEALLKYEKEIMNKQFLDNPLCQEDYWLYQLSEHSDSLYAYSRRLKRTSKDWVYKNNITE